MIVNIVIICLLFCEQDEPEPTYCGTLDSDENGNILKFGFDTDCDGVLDRMCYEFEYDVDALLEPILIKWSRSWDCQTTDYCESFTFSNNNKCKTKKRDILCDGDIEGCNTQCTDGNIYTYIKDELCDSIDCNTWYYDKSIMYPNKVVGYDSDCDGTID